MAPKPSEHTGKLLMVNCWVNRLKKRRGKCSNTARSILMPCINYGNFLQNSLILQYSINNSLHIIVWESALIEGNSVAFGEYDAVGSASGAGGNNIRSILFNFCRVFSARQASVETFYIQSDFFRYDRQFGQVQSVV